MKIRTMTNIPPDSNPFHHDPINMGQKIGKNVYVMMGNHKDEHCHHAYIVDTTTGHRIRINFAPERKTE